MRDFLALMMHHHRCKCSQTTHETISNLCEVLDSLVLVFRSWVTRIQCTNLENKKENHENVKTRCFTWFLSMIPFLETFLKRPQGIWSAVSWSNFLFLLCQHNSDSYDPLLLFTEKEAETIHVYFQVKGTTDESCVEWQNDAFLAWKRHRHDISRRFVAKRVIRSSSVFTSVLCITNDDVCLRERYLQVLCPAVIPFVRETLSSKETYQRNQ